MLHRLQQPGCPAAGWVAALLMILVTGCVTCTLTGPSSHGEPFKGQLRSMRSGNSTMARYQRPFNVCTSDWMPMVGCDYRDPADFDGYQIALWRSIATDLGWVENEDWLFTCLDWDEMMDDLMSPEGSCAVAAAGVEVTNLNILAGIKFSWPFYKNGLQVMVSSQVEQPGMWSFFEVFEWSVWLILVVSAFVLTFIITMVEIFTYGGLRKWNSRRTKVRGLRTWAWYISCKMVQVPTHVGDPRTWAARIMVMGWAFLVLIMLHAFTAKTTMTMTKQRLANSIGGPEDLPGRLVITWEPYIPMLRRYRINADALPWNNAEDEQNMLKKLHSHKYQALVLDRPSVFQMVANAPNCDLYAVGDSFEKFDLAIAYPPDVPEELAANISASLLRLQVTHGILDKLDAQFITAPPGADKCRNKVRDSSQTHDHNPQISFQQVVGLWYILAGAFAISLMITGYQCYKHSRQVHSSEAGSLASMAGLPSGPHGSASKGTTVEKSVNSIVAGVPESSRTGRKQSSGQLQGTSFGQKHDMGKSGKLWNLFVTAYDSPAPEESVPGYLKTPKMPPERGPDESFSLDASMYTQQQATRHQGHSTSILRTDSSQKAAITSVCTQTDFHEPGSMLRGAPQLQNLIAAEATHAWPDLQPIAHLGDSVEAADLDTVLKLSNNGG